MVLMATIMPVAILFCGFVIDMANWFQHDRHLQTQADAAALAGALNFMSCPDNTPIRDKVDEYSGGQWNTQVGGTQGNVHMLLNSKTYYGQTDKTDDTVVEGEPCTANMVDVKVTETDLPWWFAVGSVDFLNAHARVQLHTIDSLSGATPLGVPDVKPVKARVTWVDEDKLPGDADRILGTAELKRTTYTGGMALWQTEGPTTVKVDRPNMACAWPSAAATPPIAAIRSSSASTWALTTASSMPAAGPTRQPPVPPRRPGMCSYSGRPRPTPARTRTSRVPPRPAPSAWPRRSILAARPPATTR
jgi:hypothetical protein